MVTSPHCPETGGNIKGASQKTWQRILCLIIDHAGFLHDPGRHYPKKPGHLATPGG